MNDEMKRRLRELPQVDALLLRRALAEWEEVLSRGVVKKAVQDVLEEARRHILQGRFDGPRSWEEWEDLIALRLRRRGEPALKSVVNGTGTVLHTNLGRAVLADSASRRVAEISRSYSNVEYDLAGGRRGSRCARLRTLLQHLTGAEEAVVVNNNAAAVLLALTVMAKGRDVVISRGELVEIGGMFRIPDVISLSGAIICEVGTTNKTRLDDYRQAITENTGVIMKVHTSNYRIVGFTESADAGELTALAHLHGLPVVNDLGSGLFVDMRRFGLPYEPTVQDVLQKGCDVVTFSGDKLLGGPQAGIIAGKKKYIEAMERHPLMRALRVDKMTLAALEETLGLYADETLALKEIPVLQMLGQTEEACRDKAVMLAEMMRRSGARAEVNVWPLGDSVGGGAYPEWTLPGYAVAVRAPVGAVELARRLRAADPPCIVRIHHDTACFSVRTLQESQFPAICAAVRQALEQ